MNNFAATKSNKLSEIYVCAGNRAYLVGAQDGSFPDLGDHVPDEMGGLWIHPIKILDGFWLQVRDKKATEQEWLKDAKRFVTKPTSVIHKYELDNIELIINQEVFVPDDTPGLVVTYQFNNKSDQQKSLKLDFLGRSELSPTWLSKKLGIEDSLDQGEYLPKDEVFLAKDSQHPWFVTFGSELDCTKVEIGRDLWGPARTTGQGISGQLTYDLEVDAKQIKEVSFFIAGSADSREEALGYYQDLKINYQQLIKTKEVRYQKLLDQAKVKMPDKDLEETFNWVKFNYDMLIREVPGVGKGLGGGLPTYPWWFGTDTNYAILGLLPLGRFELAKDSLRNLVNLSEKENGNGRVIHEASTNGVVGNSGNTQETPHLVTVIYEIYRWTHDKDFLKELYPFCKKAIKDYLLQELVSDETLLPQGYGIMEIKGLNLRMVDSAVYTYKALEALGEMALIIEDEKVAKWANLHATKLKDEFDNNFWLEEEEMYGDVLATAQEVLDHIDDIKWQMENDDNQAGLEAYQAIEEQAMSMIDNKLRPWLFGQWVIATPLEMNLASEDKAIKVLKELEKNYTGKWGLHLSKYDNRIMTISTGVMAVAEANYNRADQSLDYIKRMAATEKFQMPGSLSEMSPDYGCCIQAWTGYGFSWPLIVGMLGVRPEAGIKRINFNPQLPTEWDDLSIDNLKIGDAMLDYSYQKYDNEIKIDLNMDQTDWELSFQIPIIGEQVLVNGEGIEFTIDKDQTRFIIDSDKNKTILIRK
ncbi:hypothetical protein Halha_1833 [Halobacteroides halobius DSM 5150]|uniref:Uncharacterized protein n=1 Tax=Halobacteroides halobius (strain ATCC 35273 / DSM 5150 / MD-1) TaxID=748449 RepID=L0K9Q7_HALHC|nr:hypothetical protein [Halobacteroides halobius]AGB41746.1 hypothetical protein Halha_1833 [Halobacteroides halobius DSM 5150]